MPCCLKVCSITCFRARSKRLPTCTTITRPVRGSGTRYREPCWTRSAVPDNVAGLFEFGDYDLAGWISDYIDDEAGTYYTQRWYIARRDQGSVSLCDYYPPTDDNSILNGGEWTRFETSDPGFIPMPRSGNRLFQLGTICRMVEKPCTAAQQPE